MTFILLFGKESYIETSVGGVIQNEEDRVMQPDRFWIPDDNLT